MLNWTRRFLFSQGELRIGDMERGTMEKEGWISGENHKWGAASLGGLSHFPLLSRKSEKRDSVRNRESRRSTEWNKQAMRFLSTGSIVSCFRMEVEFRKSDETLCCVSFAPSCRIFSHFFGRILKMSRKRLRINASGHLVQRKKGEMRRCERWKSGMNEVFGLKSASLQPTHFLNLEEKKTGKIA